jgi:multisubunit Na+/H+ antiporter MnhE subunit
MKTSGIAALAMAGLLVPSVWVVLKGAGDEPYTSFRASDAVVQIGVACALMALWIVLLGFITAQVVKKKLPRAWLASIVLCAVALYCLYDSPAGYISDLVKFEVVSR